MTEVSGKKRKKINTFIYFGKNSEILISGFIGTILTILTLGFYAPTAHTKMRRLIIGNLSICGNRFLYNSNAMKFLTSVILPATTAIICWIIFLATIYYVNSSINIYVYSIIAFLGLYFCYYYISYRSLRHYYNSISLNNLKGRMDYSELYCTSLRFLSLLLLFPTLGLLRPYIDISLRKYYFGTAKIGEYNGLLVVGAKKLILVSCVTTILTPFTLGLSQFWYYSVLNRSVFGGLKFGDIGFVSSETGFSKMILSLSNFLLGTISICTCTGTGLVASRNINYIALHLVVIGNILPLRNEIFVAEKEAESKKLDDFFPE